MSFPRAKIQRFNDITTSTPSPADYNLPSTTRAVGAVIPQSERFTVSQSPALSDTSSLVSQGSNGTPCVKTSAASKKTKPHTFQKPKPKELFTSGDHLEALKDKIVELNNKDLYIKDLVEQVEELKQKICVLQAKIVTSEQSYEEKLANVNIEHEFTVNCLNEEHKTELEKLVNEIKKIEIELRVIKEDYEELKVKNENDLSQLSNNIDEYKLRFKKICLESSKHLENKNEELKNKEKELEHLQQQYNEIKKEHAGQIQQLTQKNADEIQNIEYEMLKSLTEMQKQIEKEKRDCTNKINQLKSEKDQEIQTLKTQFQQQQMKLQNESEAKIKQLQEDFREANILAEMQMNEKLQDIEIQWKSKLEKQEKNAEQILKECQAISEYNIIQSELEKNTIKNELQEKMKQYEHLENEKSLVTAKCKQLGVTVTELQTQLNNIIRELDQSRETLKKEIENNKLQIQKLITDKHAYEITISKLHETIEALKKRLLNSDRDVEQLKAELEDCEKSKLEYETKCNHFSEELKLLQNLNDELNNINKATVKSTEEKIQCLEQSLHEKVEKYKTEAIESRREVETKLQVTESNLKEAMEQLHQQKKLTDESQKLINNANLELNRLEAMVTDYEFKNNRLQTVLKTLQKECDNLRNTEQEIKSKQIAASTELKTKIAENEKLKTDLEKLRFNSDEVENLMKQIAQLQEKSDSYYKYCEYYKSIANGYQQEIEELSDVRKKYIEKSSKYDDIILKYEELEKRNAELQKKVDEQELLIGPFREQLEAYEMEHRALLNEKQDAENEARTISLKYASALGHQNTKQKIKYVVDLQTKKFELLENKKELESKIRAQNRTIEKLKKEINSLTKTGLRPKNQSEDKENWSSPNRIMNSSNTESSTTPLKERN